MCDGRAYQVHHKSYDVDVMRGKVLSMLISCCNTCHKAIERDSCGSKVALQEANRRLDILLANKYRRTKKTQKELDREREIANMPKMPKLKRKLAPFLDPFIAKTPPISTRNDYIRH